MEDDKRTEISKMIEQLTREQLKELKDYLHNVIYIE
ncbi:MAG: hypothetical protein JWM44_2657 [Bacilli bacterium]|nr:hypothetical protein [Bacilli bacterium]